LSLRWVAPKGSAYTRVLPQGTTTHIIHNNIVKEYKTDTKKITEKKLSEHSKRSCM